MRNSTLGYLEKDGCYLMLHRIKKEMDINKDKYNKKLPKSFLGAEPVAGVASDIGLLEVQGLVASIKSLDAMLKAANVKLIHTEKRLGGRLCTFIISGSVSAVKAAIEAGEANAAPLGQVFGKAVIPRPHDEVIKFFDVES